MKLIDGKDKFCVRPSTCSILKPNLKNRPERLSMSRSSNVLSLTEDLEKLKAANTLSQMFVENIRKLHRDSLS